MTAFRITQRSVSQRTTANLQLALRRMSTTQDQLSSGRLIRRPSDSPVGTVSALRFRGDIRQTEQFVRNADDALGWLGSADRTLTSSLEQVRRVRDLTLQAANGSNSDASRRAIGVEILALRDSLIGLGNAKYLGRPVFGGTAMDGNAYDSEGAFAVTGAAATGKIERTIGPGERIQVNITGPEVFGHEPNDLFTRLTALANDLTNGNVTDFGAHLDALDGHSTGIVDALGQIGARFNRVESMQQRATDQLMALRSSLSEVEDIDLPATIVDMQLQETAYKAALSATARVLQPSLVDFLR
jgi:flagellar hook-associated protein 3 FlgL